jgi:hypothetical protein
MANTVPGYVFTSGSDPITASKLNLLGSPTTTVGTNEIITAMIADNSVTNAKLAQETGGGFIGRATATLGDISFLQLNDGSVTWSNSYSLVLAKSTNDIRFAMGNTNLRQYNHIFQYNSSLPNLIYVGGSGTTNLDYGNGATQWIGGAFTYKIGDGTSSTQSAFAVALVSGVPFFTTPGIGCNSPLLGIGYATGAGGTVTQSTNRTTPVTLNTVCGAITTNNTSLAALASAAFSVLNSTVAATDTVVVSIKSGSVNEKTIVKVNNVNAGNFVICVYNADAVTAETGAIVINFAVIKAVTS